MIDHLSDPGSWAETLALFPHPYLQVSEHAVCNHTEAFEPAPPRRDPAGLPLGLGSGFFDHIHVSEVVQP